MSRQEKVTYETWLRQKKAEAERVRVEELRKQQEEAYQPPPFDWLGRSVEPGDPQVIPLIDTRQLRPTNVAHAGVEPRAAKPKVLRPPGSLAMRIASLLPGGKRLRKDLEQVVADMRDEHFAALAIGDASAARVALIRGRFEMARAVLPSWWFGVVSFVARWLGVPKL